MKSKKLLLVFSLVLVSFFSMSLFAQVTLNDNQILEILEVTNDAEIDAAKLAEDDAKSKEIKEFAKMMIDEHKMNNKHAKMVIKNNKIKPEETQMSKMIKEDSKKNRDLLKKQKDLSFDKMFIDQQVAMHTKVLEDLDTKLLPVAQNAQLRTHLQATKVHIKAHLEKAKDIQSRL